MDTKKNDASIETIGEKQIDYLNTRPRFDEIVDSLKRLTM